MDAISVRKFSPIFPIACFMLLQSGCATIIKGPKQLVTIDSNVRDADVLVGSETVGKTPFNGPIKRGSSTQVTVKKEGYYPRTVTLSTQTETAFWGNILIGGVLGSSTDSGTGAMHKYSPATIQIDLSAIPVQVVPLTVPNIQAPETANPPAVPAAPTAPSEAAPKDAPAPK